MTWIAAPPEKNAEVFARLPDRFRRGGVPSRWSTLNKGGPVDSFLEGPAFDRHGRLWCTDIPFGRLFTVAADGTWALAFEYDGEPNGMRHAPDGRIWIADHRRGILVFDPQRETLEPVLEQARGEPFKGCNDLCFGSDGTVFFTDQGSTGLHDPSGRVYRLAPDGRLDLLLDNAPSPNGLVLSRDETALFVAMTRSCDIWRLPLMPEGGVRKAQLFVRLPGGLSGPDGIALLPDDGLAICHAGLGRVFLTDPLGLPRAVIVSPTGRTTTNIALGSPGTDETSADRNSIDTVPATGKRTGGNSQKQKVWAYVTESETGTIIRADLADPCFDGTKHSSP